MIWKYDKYHLKGEERAIILHHYYSKIDKLWLLL